MQKFCSAGEQPVLNSHFMICTRELDGVTDMHRHDFYEIELILDGGGRQVLNGVEYPLKKGAAYFIKPTDFHRIEADDLVLYHLSFSEKFLSEAMISKLINFNKNSLFYLPPERFSELESLCSLLSVEYSARRACRGEMLRNLLECLLLQLSRCAGETPKADSENRSAVERVILHLQLHFRDCPSLETAASIAGLSVNYFSALFRRLTGRRYIDYLNSIKLSYAHSLLVSTDLQIVDICFASGFRTMSNFLKLFSKKYGQTPSQIRKNPAYETDVRLA